RAFAEHDALRGKRDRLQTGGAEPIDGQAGGGDGQTCAKGGQPSHVLALRTFVERGTEDDVLDFLRGDAGTFHRLADDEARHIDAMRVVERTAIRFGKTRAGGGDDNCFGHEWLLWLYLFIWVGKIDHAT